MTFSSDESRVFIGRPLLGILLIEGGDLGRLCETGAVQDTVLRKSVGYDLASR